MSTGGTGFSLGSVEKLLEENRRLKGAAEAGRHLQSCAAKIAHYLLKAFPCRAYVVNAAVKREESMGVGHCAPPAHEE